MKKITLLFALLFATFGWQANAQVAIGIDQSSGYIPINPYFNNSYSQSIYPSTQINATGDITDLSFQFNGHSAIPNSLNWIIYVGHTSKTEFDTTSDWIAVGDMTEVFNGTITAPAGAGSVEWINIDITDFAYNGTDNLVVAVYETSSACDSSSDDFYSTSFTGNRSIYKYSDVAIDHTAPPTGTLTTKVSNIIFGGITQTCPTPSDLTISNVVADGVDIAWTDNAGASAWEYVIQAAGTGLPTAAGTATSTNPTTVTGLTPETDYEVYVRASCGGGDYSSWVGPTNFTTPPTCPTPSDIVFANITTTGADVSWTNNSSATTFEYVVQPTGDPAPTGAGTAVTGTTVNLTGLNHSSIYDFYVRADCGGGDFSSWTTAENFTTLCATIDTFPYNEGFESDIPCWSEDRDPSSSFYGWSTTTSGNNGNGLRFDSYYNDSGNISKLHSPTFDLTNLDYPQLVFYFKNPAGGDFTVSVSTDGGATYTELESGLTGQTDWIEKTYDLSTYVSNNVILEFKGTSNYSYGDAYIYLDDVSIQTGPSCPAPTGITVSNITTTGADVAWTSSASAWEYIVQPSGDPAPTGAGTSVTAANVNLTSLTPNTDYDFYVRADCSGGDYSTWDSPITFYTLADGIYMQDGAVSTCNENFYDTGGPRGDFQNDEDLTLTVSPSTAGQMLAITFTEFNCGLNSEYDYLKIYDGADATATLLVDASALGDDSAMLTTYTATNAVGQLTFVFHSSSVSPGAGWVGQFSCVPPTSISDNQISGFNHYPNPVNNTLNLSAQDNIESVNIYNISGQEVISITPNAVQTQVDMSRLQNGIYFVKAQINGQLTAFKVVKK